jgi:hypothetical protein
VSARHVLAALGALLVATAARAERETSPITGSFELRASPYRPDIDSEFPTAPGPYEKVFGGGRPLRLDVHVARRLWRGHEMTFELGLGAGWFQDTGTGLLEDGSPSGDRTRLRMIPLSLTGTFRVDYLGRKLGIPVFPYVRLSLERYNWWVTDGQDSVVKSGATNGWAWGGGAAFLLDVFDPTLARELDNDMGINHTAFIVDMKKARVDDFGSSKSWDLSDTASVTFSFGLAFVY